MMRRLDATCQLRPRYGTLPLIRKLTDSRKLPIGRPDAPPGPFGGAKRLDMGRHIREADDGLLRIPDGERATHESTLDQEGIAYFSFAMYNECQGADATFLDNTRRTALDWMRHR